MILGYICAQVVPQFTKIYVACIKGKKSEELTICLSWSNILCLESISSFLLIKEWLWTVLLLDRCPSEVFFICVTILFVYGKFIYEMSWGLIGTRFWLLISRDDFSLLWLRLFVRIDFIWSNYLWEIQCSLYGNFPTFLTWLISYILKSFIF